jgi:hypothetical protein
MAELQAAFAGGFVRYIEPEAHNVRFWPKADITSCTAHVRFWE